MQPFLAAVLRLIVGLAKSWLGRAWLTVRSPSTTCTVTIAPGKVRGRTSTVTGGGGGDGGVHYHSFKGIPYAVPPVGALRFQPPVPVESFQRPVLECFVEGSKCLQYDQLLGVPVGTEDGLCLNVYTPELPAGTNADRLPVMVWIHGGGFMCGSGDAFLYDPVYFMRHRVVVVTFNYRLGPLGFLSFPEAGIAGNAGLKDQLLVLRWVQQNIGAFGGDPSNVTLFGESAGAKAAYLHYLSPVSRKYFHRVICQSGVACSDFALQVEPTDKARTLAHCLGYEGSSDSEALAVLLQAPAKALFKHQLATLADSERHQELKFPFRPVVEGDLPGAIVTQHPIDSLQTELDPPIPIITGCNSGEGMVALVQARKQLHLYNAHPELLLPPMLKLPPDASATELGRKVKQFYFQDRPIGRDTLPALMDLLSDNEYITATVTAAELMARYQPRVAHYCYYFTHDGRLGNTKQLLNMTHVPGVCHGDDVFYMFRSALNARLAHGADEAFVRDAFLTMWTQRVGLLDSGPRHWSVCLESGLERRHHLLLFVAHHRWIRFWPPPVRPVVTVKQGKVRGVTATLPNGGQYHYFKGIPYAEPPVGKLRFRPPVPLERFRKSVIDCYAERADGIQKDFFSSRVSGSESCLYLNVFSPRLPGEADTTKGVPRLPVMVYVHGGGFMSGSGSSFFYNPEYFLQQDVLVVTMNYRLGPHGFLYLPSAGIPGNAGLKDQLLALKWVNENIARFGGNPDNVTLFGESAGSMSAYLHYLSPNSRKYIHRVICQSGVAVSDSFFQVEPEEKARKLARFFGYTGDSDQGVLETLEKVSAKELAKHQNEAISEAEKLLALIFIFRPVVEQHETADSIITQHPRVLLKTYDTLRLPLLEGCNSGEGILALKSLGERRWKSFGREPERFVPVLLGRSPDLDRPAVGREIQRFYFGDRPVDDRTIDKMCDVMSDNTFITNSVTSAEWLAKYQPNAPHYHYRFTYDGRFSMLKRVFQLSNVSGACHGDDTMYMFNPWFLPSLPPSSEECRVRDIMIALWTNFAKHGHPSDGVPEALVPVRWEPVRKIARDSDDFNLDCLEINTTPRMVRNPGAGRIELWRGLLKKYRADYLLLTIRQLIGSQLVGTSRARVRCSVKIVFDVRVPDAKCVGAMTLVAWDNLWQFVLAVVRLGRGVVAFLVHHLHVRLCPPRDCPLVSVRQGQLRGVAANLPNGARYYYFKGVPYAEAPVGKLRFKAPVALERYRKPIVNCYAERTDSIQLDFFSGFVYGSERGLYLNVYTPQLPVDGPDRDDKSNRGLPVMVFLHGGGFACGSGSSLFYNPEYFLQRGVLVVTINYRLGPFGFLYLPEAGIEGNAGLKDQLMALRWINENITSFGGDPHNVTLFGESAGSFSAYLHMLSLNSRKTNLFYLSRHFVVETLQQVPAKQLAKHQRKALGKGADQQADLVFIFLPVVEQTLSEHSIITKPPEELLKTYDTLQMPLLEGCNDAEGILGLYIMRHKARNADIRHLPDRMAAKVFRHLGPTERASVTEQILKFYFNDAPPSGWSTEQLKHFLTDVIFAVDSARAAEWIARYQPNVRHYHYRFTYDGRFSLLKRLFLSAAVPGACHGDDLMYMFNPKLLPKLAPSSDECRVRDNVVALWTSFAKHGDPSVEAQDVVSVQWRPIEKVPRNPSAEFRLECLEINVQPAMVDDPSHERTRFWRDLLAVHGNGQR
uniref:carboxylesterase n=1 Tax=Anopheles dirus TaxID=7168 RepID=A0A182NJS3_9DIPT